MSFLQIKDPKQRDQLVQEYIQQNNLKEKLNDIGIQQDLTKLFKPVIDTQTEQTKNIINKLDPIQQEIKDLPRIQYSMSTPTLPSIHDADDFHSIPSVIDESESEPIIDDEPIVGSVIGPVAEKYLKLFTNKKGGIDKPSGLHTDSSTGNFKIGDKVIGIDYDNIIIGKKKYEGTQGLWELIVNKNPDENVYTDDDLVNYEEIMEKTHALRRNYDENSVHPIASKSPKWKKIGQQIWKRIKEKEGSGVETVIIPRDPNALVKRLKLYMQEIQE